MSAQDDFLIISIAAKQGANFASYDLLQAIVGTGMQFGARNLFHYYSSQHFSQFADDQQERNKDSVLFSLAAATPTGEFDLDRIGEFSCTGLVLFINLKQSQNPQHAFDLMLKTAEQLADDLEGELRASPHTPWNDKVLQQYKQRIAAALSVNL